MTYNYTDAPFYANVNQGTLTTDGTQIYNLVITKETRNEDPPHETNVEYYTYDIAGLTVTQVDELTRQKIQELNG
jgi:hypothetical protein